MQCSSARLPVSTALLVVGIFALPLCLALAAPDDSPPLVEVTLTVADIEGRTHPDGQFRIRSLDNEGNQWQHFAAERSDTEISATTQLPRSSRWRVCLDFPGRWAPCENLTAGQSEPVRLETWPSTQVTGRFHPLPEGTDPPERVLLRFSAVKPPRREGFTQITVGCTLEELAWSCEVPALELDLELRPTGFIPEYRFGVQLTTGKQRSLGKTSLKRGASLIARVETEDGELVGREAVARLLPLAPGLGDSRWRDRVTRPVAEAKVTDDGFLQLASLPAGSYTLTVSRPGYAPTTLSPLQILEAQEMRLRSPIVLEKPLTLEVVASPPLDWLDRPWLLKLERTSRLTGARDRNDPFEGELDETGRVQIPDQTPGSFTLQLLDSLGNPLFGLRDLEVAGAADAQIAIALDLLVVRGAISYQGEPVTANLWFGLRHGGIHSEMAADLDGNFSGVLPEPGWWTVEIDVPSLALTRYQTRLEVRPDSRGDAEVEIELPDTEVTGRVVDSQGRPVAGAEVAVATNQWARRTSSDDDGSFRFAVVEPGLVGLGASHRKDGVERTSDGHQVQVAEEQPTPPVELVLRDLKTFRGRVVSERGPIPGAVVLVATAAPLVAASQAEARTGADGAFDVRLSPRSRRLHGAVAPPGHALRAFELPASDVIELTVPAAGGTVSLDLGPRPGQHDERQPELWGLYQDGLGLPFRVLHQWARGHGVAAPDEATGRWRLPHLAPGHYRLCRLAAAPVLGQEPTPLDCAEGFLSSGGQLDLALPRG